MLHDVEARQEPALVQGEERGREEDAPAAHASKELGPEPVGVGAGRKFDERALDEVVPAHADPAASIADVVSAAPQLGGNEAREGGEATHE